MVDAVARKTLVTIACVGPTENSVNSHARRPFADEVTKYVGVGTCLPFEYHQPVILADGDDTPLGGRRWLVVGQKYRSIASVGRTAEKIIDRVATYRAALVVSPTVSVCLSYLACLCLARVLPQEGGVASTCP